PGAVKRGLLPQALDPRFRRSRRRARQGLHDRLDALQAAHPPGGGALQDAQSDRGAGVWSCSRAQDTASVAAARLGQGAPGVSAIALTHNVLKLHRDRGARALAARSPVYFVRDRASARRQSEEYWRISSEADDAIAKGSGERH